MQHVDKLAEARAREISQHLNGLVLDVGCNTQLLRQYCRGYIGIDLDRTSELSPDVIGTVEYLPFKQGSFNTVVLSEVIEHVDNPSNAIAECARVSRETVIITTPNPFRLDYLLEWIIRRNDITCKYHVARFSRKEMITLISRHLNLIEYYNVFLEIPTFSRIPSVFWNIRSRFGSCSVFVTRHPALKSEA